MSGKGLVRVATTLMIFILLAGCNVVNHLKMRFANDDLKVNWPSAAQTLALETHYIGEKPHVKITVNGQQDFLFLIDTGASLTYLMDTPSVRALGLQPGFKLDVGGWGDGQDSEAYQTTVSSLSLAGAEFSDVSVAFLPVSKSPYYLRPDEAIIDGVLGHDILRHFVWQFDKLNETITLSRSAYLANERDVAVDFTVSMSKLAIPVEVNLGLDTPVRQDVLIDTGSRHFFKMSQTYLDDEGIALDRPAVEAADFGLSGQALHRRVTLDNITIGGLAFDNVKTNLIRTEDPDDFWVIGSALLNQFVSVIDYQQNKLYLRPHSDHRFQSRYNLIGLELRKLRDGRFVVRYVMPDMAAANYDFQVGDVISQIAGEDTRQISQEKWLSLTAQPGIYMVCRERSEQQCFAVTSQHVPGYSTL